MILPKFLAVFASLWAALIGVSAKGFLPITLDQVLAWWPLFTLIFFIIAAVVAVLWTLVEIALATETETEDNDTL